MKLKVPHTLVLLFSMMVIGLLLTYLLPSGAFDTVEKNHKQTVVAGTYQTIEKDYLKPWELFTVLPRAFADSQGIIFFVFIIGGSLSVIKATGVIDAVLGKVLNRFSNQPQVLILAGMLVFSIGSSTLGMAEEYLPFISILIVLCAALRLDTITALGIMIVGYGVGYGTATINPFTLLIAQDIAEVKPTSGMWYRLIMFVPFFIIGFLHVRKYAMRVWKENLAVKVEEQELYEYPSLTKTHVVIVLITLVVLALIVYGISDLSGWGWYLTELGGLFFALALIVAIIGRINMNEAARKFGEGATELATTALLIGFARSIALILEDGQVLHTIVHYFSIPLQQTGPHIASVGMYLIQSVLNFFIPSGSGQAYVTMPLMAPIGDLVGVSRQISVLAYQMGDGFMNMVVPTNAVLMGIIGIANVPYDKWFKFIAPLILKFFIMGSIALIVAVLIGYN
jgi:uncharacterized ion transporter superfamily protein YfcC